MGFLERLVDFVSNPLSSSPNAAVQNIHPLRLSNFKVLEVIGEGAFARVVLAQKLDDGQWFALKVIQKRLLIQEKLSKDAFNERNVMMESNHPFILKLHGTFQTQNKLFFILDFAEGGDFAHFLKKQPARQLDVRSIQFYAAELFLALTFLHSHGILYRDLKPENILMTSAGHLLLADFGIAKKSPRRPSANSFAGSPYYVSPDVIYEGDYGEEADWWSYGILLFEMFYGRTPFRGKTVKNILDAIVDKPLQFPPAREDQESDCDAVRMEEAARDLISSLLVKEPEDRLTEKQIQKHSFFAGICFEDVLKLKVKPTNWTAPPLPESAKPRDRPLAVRVEPSRNSSSSVTSAPSIPSHKGRLKASPSLVQHRHVLEEASARAEEVVQPTQREKISQSNQRLFRCFTIREPLEKD